VSLLNKEEQDSPSGFYASWFYARPTGDPGRDRNARTVQFASLLLAFAVCTVAILNITSGEPGENPFLAFAGAGLVAAMILNRVGRWQWGARIAVSAVLVTAMLLVFEARDGFRSHAMVVFPGMLLLGVMLLDRASYMITGGIVLVAVAALGIAENHGLTRAVPHLRSSTSYESIVIVDLVLLIFALIGSRIVRDAQSNVFDLRATIAQVLDANRELSEAAEALREDEQQLVSIYNTVQDGIFHLAVEPGGRFRFVSVNRAFLKVTGLSLEMVVGKTVNQVIPEPSLAMALGKYQQASEEHTVLRWEETSDYPSGRLIAEVSVAPVFNDARVCTHLVGSFHDITGRKRAEAEREWLQRELAHAQKMESVGRLAGGVAHDFNNLMSVIMMHGDLAVEQLREGQSAVESVREIRGAAARAVGLCRQLMDFSGKQVPQTEILNLNSVIADGHELVRRLIGEDVKVRFKAGSGSYGSGLNGSGSYLVRADRGQLGQILMNLAVNSRDAMPEGGTFTIETAAVELNGSGAQLSPDAQPGAYVTLVVRDTGIGMDEETRARAFEPFFTTKEIGKGTGLGLSIVYGIVKQSGGFVTVTSEAGHGTEFRIYLPAVREIAEPTLVNGEAPIRGGFETILLVEDDAAIRKTIQELLEKVGYRVLAAPDGEQAYRLSLEDARPIHLLLTDIVMPEMSGFRLSDRLLSLRPGTKILYMSGYPDATDARTGARSFPNFLQKPLTKDRLLRRVREVLDGNDATAAAT
jgi:PAS domain S-box-containing protein